MSDHKCHNAFPIIDCEPHKDITKSYDQKDGKFVGVMLRWHIMILLSKRNFAALDSLCELPLLSVNDLTDSEYKNRYIRSYQKQFGISLHELNHYFVDFSPYMHLSPFTVTSYAPIYRVYTLFRGLGLRHLIVLDSNNKFVDGIITAQDLCEVALETAVHKFNLKITRNKHRFASDNDYVCYRLQQMSQSKICQKYNISKRLTQSIDVSKVFGLVSGEEEQKEEDSPSKSISKFSIATDDKDMQKQTVNDNENGNGNCVKIIDFYDRNEVNE